MNSNSLIHHNTISFSSGLEDAEPTSLDVIMVKYGHIWISTKVLKFDWFHSSKPCSHFLSERMTDKELKVEIKVFRFINLDEIRDRVKDAHKRRSEISSSHVNFQADKTYKTLQKHTVISS